MKTLMRILVLLFMGSLLFPNLGSAQCNGNITIEKQSKLNDFNCTTWKGGSVTISGNSITDLTPLGLLESFQGDLIIDNNPNLVKLDGLENIEFLDGNLVVRANAILATLGSKTYKVEEITKQLIIKNCPNLTTKNDYFPLLQKIGAGLVIDNTSSVDGFDNLQECPSIHLENIGNSVINGFSKVVLIENLEISNCPDLQNINNFNEIQAIKGLAVFGTLAIVNNNKLKIIDGLSSLKTVDVLTITGNSALESCCNVLPALLAKPKTVNIGGNASGCATENQINAKPVLANCPTSTTVNNAVAACTASYSILQPSPSDNCDLSSTNVRLMLADGSIPFSQNISPGSSTSHSLQVGVNVFRFQAQDGAGNSTVCTASITVTDGTDPSFANCPPNTTIGTCFASYTLTEPTPSDNCGVVTTNARLTLADASVAFSRAIQAGATSMHTLQEGVNVFRFSATDAEGNEEICNTTVTVQDIQAPLSLTNCPTSVTVDTDSNVLCSGTFSYNAPTVSGGCSIVSFKEKISLGGSVISNTDINSGQSYSQSLNTGVYSIEYTLEDSEGETENCAATVTVVDIKAPLFGGIPANVTISCDDPFPAIPVPTATDLCDGNVTGSITASSSVSQGGNCMPGDAVETTEYSWTVTDAAGNAANANWTVTIISDFEFDLGSDLSICGGNSVTLTAGNIGTSYLWSTGATGSSISASTAGTYGLTITSANGCCFSDEVMVSGGQDPDASATGGMISCAAGSIALSGSSTTAGVSYGWTGPGGFTSSNQNPSVTENGTYTLTVTTSVGCSSTAQAVVTADTNAPNVSTTGGQLSCSVSTTNISANSTTSGVSYSWTGPSGFSSTSKDNEVNEPGIYTVKVTSSNGCSATANAEVTSDDAGPTVALQAGDLNCNIQETVIDVTASSDAVSYTWTGPEGFSSEEKEPEVSTIGLYTIMVLGDNGCVSTNEIFIDGDYSMPNVTAAGGKISCSDNETSISGATTTPNAVYSWSGPNDFASSLQNPFISQPGTYILTVIGENGCTASAEAVVEGDGEIPIISASGGKIDCVTESVMIIGAVEGSGATTVWTGPNGFSTSNLTAEIDIPGSYIFTATSPGGCKTFASVEVLLDNSDPTFSLMEGEVDCDDAQGQFLLLTDAEDPVFQWTGPNGFSSTEQVPEYTLAGKYDVTITGGNSCISTGSITVDHDIAYSFDVSTNGGDANIEIIGGTPTFIILWNGVTAGNNVTNLNLGENFVSIEDGLGCSEIFFFDITSSTKDLTTVEGIRVYPNPAGDFLNLELSKELSKGEIRIFNQQGMTVQTSAISNQVDVSSLATGLYYLRLTAGEADYFYKFIKQ